MAELLTGTAREERRAAVAELGAALRELVDAAVRTEVPADDLAAAADTARRLAAQLRAGGRGLYEVASVDDPVAGERWYSPVYGPGSPVAPPLLVDSEGGGRATARVTVPKALEGPPGLVHGGTIATLLDHVLARALRSAGRGGLTATLTVTYRRPVRLGVEHVLTAEVASTEGRRSTARARIVAADDPGTVLAEGEGLFVALRPEAAAATFAGVDHAPEAWTARP
ncbi:PaaI family thioesterase [Klenkia sp. PcliD-1-E]|uniref:PaaI family thioesterase n=1 Tax=Klenkia sp. PcliD-1-E TaxID=2954492 RepID=UPI002096B92A|nr:PaaI family thioesterase [Klenkia sp. PcliD-1-E]MCO7220770.1 PaaI family thioesterase [Klenkia sp. PcliD-1-E]